MSSVAALFVIGTNLWVVLSTADQVHFDAEEITGQEVVLLLGTSKNTSSGELNQFFDQRINSAAQLYNSGKIAHILVSGDNRTNYYNEPRDMYQALVEKGVAKEDVTLDFAGLRTLDSIIRGKKIFGLDSYIIVTQEFHCYRALFIANKYDIAAISFAADDPDYLAWKIYLREVIARSLAVLDLYVFNKEPRYLGQQEPLEL
ncbi:MAG: YdcF family protein [Cyclobacteriaceae bacterium]|nr:YdcF family protein [Cyclobacteriaceae bacterium HetDA_MAG_MS6]